MAHAGSVCSEERARTSSWAPVGRFAGRLYTARIDASSGWIVALDGERASPYDASGAPQSVAWPTSRSLHLCNVRGEWSPETRELPFDGRVAAIVAGRIVAIGSQGAGAVAASIPASDLAAPWRLDALPGLFEGFAGSHGLITSGFASPRMREGVTLSMHVWRSDAAAQRS